MSSNLCQNRTVGETPEFTLSFVERVSSDLCARRDGLRPVLSLSWSRCHAKSKPRRDGLRPVLLFELPLALVVPSAVPAESTSEGRRSLH